MTERSLQPDVHQASTPLTVLLLQARDGSSQAQEEVYSAAYTELRMLASSLLRHERPGHTLAPTALVHEAYMKLTGGAPVAWQDHGHFFRAAAQSMRRILIDHARSRGRDKRGGGAARASLTNRPNLTCLAGDGPSMMARGLDEEFLAVDEVICRLESEDAETGEIVRLRFFGGLTEAQTALVLGISERTVRRRWNFAKGWMLDALQHPQAG